MRPFLKEAVKRERFPSRSLRNGSAGGDLLVSKLISWTALQLLVLHSSRLSSPREVAIDLFKAIAPNTFLREVRLTITISSSVPRTDADLSSCEFLTERATPSKASCRMPRSLLIEVAASTVSYELAQSGGISSCHAATQIEQPADLRSSCLLLMECQCVK
jgi:hypothetical protein